MNELKFNIEGESLQMVEIELQPNESVFSESGAMIYMEDGIKMTSKLGSNSSSGLFGALTSAVGNMLVGENAFITNYKNETNKNKKVAFGGNFPGKIIALDLKDYPSGIYAQKGAFLCSAMENNLEISLTKKISSGFFGGEGFILQKLIGKNMVFLHAGGHLKVIDLNNETIFLDTGTLVAFEGNINFDVVLNSGIKNILFSGEGLTLAKLSGKGSIVVQSMPFDRLVGTIHNSLRNIKP